MRLIDADETEEYIREVCCAGCRKVGAAGCRGCEIDDAITAVDGMPTVRTEKPLPAPKPLIMHGHWDEIWTTGKDGRKFRYWRHAHCKNRVAVRTDYCSRCGARMDL